MLFHALLWAVAVPICAFGGDVEALPEHLDVLSVGEDLDEDSSVCLLQKETIIESAKQPAGYDGPWVDPNGLDKWERYYVSDPIHGAYFENPKNMGDTTTLPVVGEAPGKAEPPTPSPVDGLQAPGPAPVPALASGQAIWQHATWSAALFGVATLWIVFYILFSTPGHKGLQSTTQYTLSTTLAVLLAKLFYAAIDLFTSASLQNAGLSEAYWTEFDTKDGTKEAVFVRLAIIGSLYVLTQILLVTPPWVVSKHEKTSIATAKFCAALLGFALVDACGVMLRLHNVQEDPWNYFGVASLCGLAIAAFLWYRVTFMHGERAANVSETDPYTAAVAELDNTMVAIALGFLVTKVIEVSVLGGEVRRGALAVESNSEIAWLMVAVPILIACAFAATADPSDQDSRRRERLTFHAVFSHRTPSRVADLVQMSLLMAAGWCAEESLLWRFSSGMFQVDLLQSGFSTPPLFAALTLSAAAFVALFFLGQTQLSNEPNWHRWFHQVDHTYWNLMMALGFMVGLAWATCFVHCARDVSSIFVVHPHIAEACCCLALALFLLPFWIIFILPEPHRSILSQAVEAAEEGFFHNAQAAVQQAFGSSSPSGSASGAGMLGRLGHKADSMVDKLTGRTH